MKAFLIKSLGFIIIPIIVITVLEAAIFFGNNTLLSDKSMDREYSNLALDYNWLNEIKSENKVFLMGSSSVRYGLSCSILNNLANDSLSFLNLARDARSPIESYVLLRNINLDGVKQIYYGLDPWIFAKNYYKHHHNYLYFDFNILESIAYSKEKSDAVLKIRYKNLIRKMIPFKDTERRTSTDDNKEIPIDFGSHALVRQPINFKAGNMNKSYKIDKYGWSELQFDYMEKILDLCINQNIELIVFVPPKRSDYSIAYTNECSLVHDEFVSRLAGVGFNAPIFGVFNQLDSLNQDLIFAEPYHLNSFGQKVYSEIFFKLMYDKHQGFSSDYSWVN